MERRTRSSTAEMAGLEAAALTTMNDLRKEVVLMSRKLATLKSARATTTVYEAMILALEDLLTAIDGRVRMLVDENYRTQSALKHINDVMENQMVVHNVVNLTTAEAVHRIFVHVYL